MDTWISSTGGDVVSAVHVRMAGVGSLFPATSVAVTWKVCDPSARSSKVCGEAQPSISSSSMKQTKVEGSLEENVKVAELVLTVPEGPEFIVTPGGVLSTVTVRPEEVVELEAISSARAVSVIGPSATEV